MTGGGQSRVFNLDFPIGEGKQTYQNWEMVLNSVKRFITSDSVFFCHSSSCIFLIKYCVRNNVKIGKAIFVSGFNNYLDCPEEYNAVNCTMFTNRASEFIPLCKKRVCFYSHSDPFLSLDALQEFAHRIQAEERVVEDAGHFNKAAGYTKFEALKEFI